MEVILREKLEPVIQEFIKGCLRIEGDIKAVEDAVQKKIKELDAEKKFVSDLKAEEKKKVDVLQEKMKAKIKRQEDISMEIQAEIIKYTDMEKFLKDKVAKIDKNLKSAEYEKSLAHDLNERAKEKNKLVDEKLAVLKIDSEAGEKKTRELAKREMDVAVKENALLEFEAKLTKIKSVLEEKEAELKIQENEIRKEKKILKAQQG